MVYKQLSIFYFPSVVFSQSLSSLLFQKQVKWYRSDWLVLECRSWNQMERFRLSDPSLRNSLIQVKEECIWFKSLPIAGCSQLPVHNVYTVSLPLPWTVEIVYFVDCSELFPLI